MDTVSQAHDPGLKRVRSLAPGPPSVGLTGAEAARRLRSDGANALPTSQTRSQLRIIGEVLKEPMLLLLLLAGGAYLLLGSLTEALVLLAFAGFSVTVTIVQESRTEHVLQSLRDLAAPRALVMRDGKPLRIPGREVVRGDMLILEQGDRVAADARLLEAADLAADESLLTGESLPVGKRAARPDEALLAGVIGGDDRPWVYSGALVTRGRGLAEVIATGATTQIGQIGQLLAGLEMEAPRLQRQVLRIVRFAAAGAGVMTLAVILLYGWSRGDWLSALLAGIAIGMSLLPEEFPVVLTVFLAMGAWRISKAGVLTRRAATIETLGAATILCVDKTGTLTCNRMAVSELWYPEGSFDAVPAKDVPGKDRPASNRLLQLAAQASAALPSDPMEIAFHEAASSAADGAAPVTMVRAYPFTPPLLVMANAWRSDSEDVVTLACKGAPEAIARLCGLEGEACQALEAASRAMARRGMRVIGVAEAITDGDGVQADLTAHRFALRGLVGLADPLRPDVAVAVAQCRAAGIRVIMITGDHAETARAIALQAGLDAGIVLTGEEIDRLDEEELAEHLLDVQVCARTLPAQKLRIVEALKAADEIVAMTGDGVNDAPALKAAQIGIAMGRRGTDVAREAASLVLVEDRFSAIVDAIRLGRRIYDNLRKAMGFIFSVHVPIAGLAILPLVTGLPILFGPIQIALIELIIDPVCALVFEDEDDEENLMSKPPRASSEPLFSSGMITQSIGQGALAFLLLSALYLGALRSGMATDAVRATMFFALVAVVLALVLVSRSFDRSILATVRHHNVALRWILAGIAAGSVAILMLRPLQILLHFAPPPPIALLMAASTGFLLLLALQRLKLRDHRVDV